MNTTILIVGLIGQLLPLALIIIAFISGKIDLNQ
jgi:hypothetical protein